MASARGAEDARNHLPELLDAAERGESTINTKRGRPVAVLAPMESLAHIERQRSLLDLAGTGGGLWGADSAATLRALRDEWSR